MRLLKIMPERRMSGEWVFYAIMLFGSWADVAITVHIILVNAIAAFNAVNTDKILLSLAGIRIVTELDNWYGSWFIAFCVRTTTDGFQMTKPQGYTTKSDGQNGFVTTRNDEFFHYWDLDILDIRAAAIWCNILIWWTWW